MRKPPTPAKKRAPRLKPEAEGIFWPEGLYTLAAVKTRLGWGSAAINKYRRCGLKVLRIGNSRFIVGQALIDFVISQGTED